MEKYLYNLLILYFLSLSNLIIASEINEGKFEHINDHRMWFGIGAGSLIYIDQNIKNLNGFELSVGGYGNHKNNDFVFVYLGYENTRFQKSSRENFISNSHAISFGLGTKYYKDLFIKNNFFKFSIQYSIMFWRYIVPQGSNEIQYDRLDGIGFTGSIGNDIYSTMNYKFSTEILSGIQIWPRETQADLKQIQFRNYFYMKIVLKLHFTWKKLD